MNKIITFFIFIFCFLSNVFALELPIESKNAILYNLDTEAVLYEKNSEEEIAMASLTKIMTAVITLENVDNLESTVTMTWEDYRGIYEVGASTAGFQYNETVTIRDLLYGLLLPSGAEAAQALTRVVAGHEKFIQLMNEKAAELNMNHTHFVNETGLDAENHYSSVKDIATLFQYALTIPTFKEIIEAKSYTTTTGKTFYSTTEKAKLRYHLDMDYLIGGKTGTTLNAGLCLASIAKAFDVNYMLVTCRAPNDWSTPKHLMDAKTIYDYFIDHYGNQDIIKEGEMLYQIPTYYAKEKMIPVYSPVTINKYLEKEIPLNTLNFNYEEKEKVTPLTKPKENIGVMHIFFEGEEIYTFDVFLTNKVSIDWNDLIKKYSWIVVLLGIIFIIIFYVALKKKRKKRK